MVVDPVTGGVIPALSGEQIVASAPGIRSIAQVEIRDFARLPGPHMTPDDCLRLSRDIGSALADSGVTGVVVAHGTDTLEETAFIVDLVLDPAKPVVFCGAMRNASELSWDGPGNLMAAAVVAASQSSTGRGVLVVMNEGVHAAAEVTKTHTECVDAFRSPDFGPLGIVEKGRVLYYRDAPPRVHIPTARLDARVDLFKAAIGVDDRLIRYSVDCGTHGIVVEGTGCGNVTPPMAEGIRYAISRNIPVVLVSRCPRGRVLDTYGYDGGGRRLREMGVIFGDNLNGQKARMKLMAALGAGFDRRQIREAFEQGRY